MCRFWLDRSTRPGGQQNFTGSHYFTILSSESVGIWFEIPYNIHDWWSNVALSNNGDNKRRVTLKVANDSFYITEFQRGTLHDELVRRQKAGTSMDEVSLLGRSDFLAFPVNWTFILCNSDVWWRFPVTYKSLEISLNLWPDQRKSIVCGLQVVVLTMFRSICEGVQCFHTARPRPLAHRDIKTANILLQDDLTPCLMDLGRCHWQL